MHKKRLIFVRSRRGIEKTLVAAAFLLVVAGGAATGAVYYYYQGSLASAGSSKTIAQTYQATSANTNSSTSGASSTTPSTTGLSSANTTACLNETSLLGNTTFLADFIGELKSLYTLNSTANDLFGNFSQMALSVDISLNGTSYGGASVDSYTVVGRPVINSVEYYEVNFNSSAFGTTTNETALFAPDGNASSITAAYPIGDLNGSSAATEGQTLVSPFLYELQTTAYARAIEASPAAEGFVTLNETNVSLGGVSVPVTYYTLKSLPPTLCGTTMTEDVLGVGTFPGTNLPLDLYTNFAMKEQGIAIQEVETFFSLKAA